MITHRSLGFLAAMVAAIVLVGLAFAGARTRPAARAASPAPASATSERPLPEAQAQKIDAAQREIARLQLVIENSVLEAALEMGLKKEDLTGQELAHDAGGRMVFRKPDKPTSGPEQPAPIRRE